MTLPRRCALLALCALLFPAARAEARIGDPSEDFPSREPRPIYATDAPNLFLHNIGGITLQLTNLGIIGNPYNNELSLGFMGFEYLSQASLWVGGLTENGIPRVSSSVAGTRRLEFRPTRQSLDTIYRGYEGMPNGRRPGFFLADDDGDGRVDEDFLNGRDDDGDGLIDEDFSAVGQQMFTCEYSDDTPEALAQIPDHVPMGLKVQQRSFQWTEEGINEFVGLDFRIRNIGDQRLSDLYVGLYVDGDVGPKTFPGYFEDDMVGLTYFSRTVRNPLLLDYFLDPEGNANPCINQTVSGNLAYMWDAPDEDAGAARGDAPGYLGCMYLGYSGDTDREFVTSRQVPDPTFTASLSTVRWTASQAPYPEGDPRTDEERYDFLSRGGRAPGTSRSHGDYRFIMAAGPYLSLDPGDEIHFEAALLAGANFSSLVSTAVQAQLIYDGTRLDADHDPLTGIDGKERCLRILEGGARFLDWNDPCDSTEAVIRWLEPTCLWVDDDCTPCTGFGGRETLVHWQVPSLAPEPTINTGPDIVREMVENPESQAYYEAPGRDRRVVLQWDNRSEIKLDPYTGRNIFEGYRIWRVDSWSRPKGAVGPAPDDWKLLAEFRRSPRDGAGTQSPLHLRRIERFERNAIREMTPGGPLYHVGRYEWADTAGIVNGKIYYYSVTAFSIDRRFDPNTGLINEVIVGGLPSAAQKEMVVATWGHGDGCGAVRVVPNPYRGGADWDLVPNDCDASGTRIAFRNLPAGWERIDIHTLSGDLVFSGRPGESRVVGGCEVADNIREGGTFFWDLISRNGQDVTSGIYLYSVATGGTPCRGRFVVIR